MSFSFLVYGDPHLRIKRPRSRRPGFYDQLLKKFADINEIGRKYKVKAKICLGDLFDDEAGDDVETIAYDIAKLMQDHLVVIGNHDQLEKSIDTRGTKLGVLEAAGIVRVPREDVIIDDVLFRFGHYEIRDKISYEVTDHENYNLMVACSHDMMLPSTEQVKYDHKVIGTFKSDFDVHMLGHYHYPFRVDVEANKGISRDKHPALFYNPGSITRLAAKQRDYDRTPKVAVVEVTGKGQYKITEVDLPSALPWKDVFDLSEHDREKELVESESNFVKSVKEMSLDSFDRMEVVTKLVKEASPEERVADYAIARIRDWNAGRRGDQEG